jgi:SET domain-containing protein
MASPLIQVSIRKTAAKGRGVFARKTFRKNQAIGEMRGKLGDHENCDPAYCVDLGDYGTLDPYAPFRCLNHSCEPNCELIEYEANSKKGPPRIFVHARKTVREGDELTIDYGWPAYAAIPCVCGSARCRGWIVAKRELKLVKRTLERRSA